MRRPCCFSRIAAIIGIVISERYSSSPVTKTTCGTLPRCGACARDRETHAGHHEAEQGDETRHGWDTWAGRRTTSTMPFIVRQWPGNVQTNG